MNGLVATLYQLHTLFVLSPFGVIRSTRISPLSLARFSLFIMHRHFPKKKKEEVCALSSSEMFSKSSRIYVN